MRVLITHSLVLLIAVTVVAMLAINTTNADVANHDTDSTPAENPLLGNWEGPYGGVPPFDRVQVPLFKPALETAMSEQLAEIDKIAKDPAAPDFENTIAALERTGGTLDRVTTIYGVWGGKLASPEY